jgi:integrase
MGHKDIRTTLDIYAEISESRKKEIFAEIDERMVL